MFQVNMNFILLNFCELVRWVRNEIEGSNRSSISGVSGDVVLVTSGRQVPEIVLGNSELDMGEFLSCSTE